jgi:hypothetical protein
MKAYWGSGGIARHILGFGIRRRWGVSFTPGALYPQGKSPCYPLDRRLCGPQSRSGCGGENKNSRPLPGLEPPIIQPHKWVTDLKLGSKIDTLCNILPSPSRIEVDKTKEIFSPIWILLPPGKVDRARGVTELGGKKDQSESKSFSQPLTFLQSA